jgi:hypothetical protein
MPAMTTGVMMQPSHDIRNGENLVKLMLDKNPAMHEKKYLYMLEKQDFSTCKSLRLDMAKILCS